MKLAGKIVTAALLAILLLSAGYWAMRGSGHWIIDFSSETNQGVVVIHLDSDPTRKAKIVFPQAQGFPAAQVILKTHDLSLPRGKIVFFDNTTRPGHMILEIDGHRLDIMKRAIVVDGTQHSWTPTETIELQARQ